MTRPRSPATSTRPTPSRRASPTGPRSTAATRSRRSSAARRCRGAGRHQHPGRRLHRRRAPRTAGRWCRRAGPARSRRRTSRATPSSASPARSAKTSWPRATGGGLDAIYLDLHGAAVAEHADDSEGELLARLRRDRRRRRCRSSPASTCTPTSPGACCALADALVAYRTYPHVDMAATGERAAELLARRLARRPARADAGAPAAVPDPAERAEHLARAGEAPLRRAARRSTASSARVLELLHGLSGRRLRRVRADGVGPRRARRDGGRAALRPRRRAGALAARDPADARDAVVRALALAEARPRRRSSSPTRRTTPAPAATATPPACCTRCSRRAPAQRFPGQVALGLMFDPAAARAAHEAGVGAELDLALGTAVPTFTGQAERPAGARPLQGAGARATAVCTLKGPMMHGLTVQPRPERLPRDRRHPHRRRQRQEAAARPRAAAHGRHPRRADADHRRQELEPLSRRLPADRLPRARSPRRPGRWPPTRPTCRGRSCRRRSGAGRDSRPLPQGDPRASREPASPQRARGPSSTRASSG